MNKQNENRNLHIQDIRQQDQRSIYIEWSDENKSLIDVVQLRKKCPCAVCIDEHTGAKKLDEQSIKDSIRPVRVYSIGRYAIGVHFNDGHKTGIYTYPLLRSLSASQLH